MNFSITLFTTGKSTTFRTRMKDDDGEMSRNSF